MRTAEEERRRDVELLRQLAVGHHLVAGLTALLGCSFLLHVAMGIFLLNAGGSHAHGPAPPWFAWFWIAMGSALCLAFWAAALLLALAGNQLRKRRRHGFCFVVAIVACAFPPLGTSLGVLSILVLARESAKRLFDLPGGGVARGA